MSQGRLILAVLFCYSFCEKQYYLGGFSIPGDKEGCYCFERLDKSTPLPMSISLYFRETPWLKEWEQNEW